MRRRRGCCSGIAQLKAGHKDDAVKTFNAVKGDPALERLANLWSLHAKQASEPPPATPAKDSRRA